MKISILSGNFVKTIKEMRDVLLHIQIIVILLAKLDFALIQTALFPECKQEVRMSHFRHSCCINFFS